MATLRRRVGVPAAFLAAVGALFGLAPAVSCGGGLDPSVSTFTLDNGLRVFVRPIPGAKGAFVRVLYAVGEEDDPPGASGLAAMMRILYERTGAGGFLASGEHVVGQENGGLHESSLQDDHTTFCDGVPADFTRAALREAAARMEDLRIGAADVDAARDEVLRSMEAAPLWFVEGLADRPRREARERLLPLGHGGRRGGRRDDVLRISLDQVRERWRRLYKPANAILVVTGNVDPALVEAGVRRRFGRIPAGERAATAARSVVTAPPDAVHFRQGLWWQTSEFAKSLAPPEAGAPGPLPTSAALLAVMSPVSTACLSLVGPPTTDARHMAAALVLARRIEARATDSEARSFEEQFARVLGHRFAGRGFYRPGVDASTLDLVWQDEDTPGDASAIAMLRRRLDEAARRPVTDAEIRDVAGRDAARELVTANAEQEWPASVALGIARRAQLGMDGQAILDELPHVTPADLAWVASRPSAGVVFAVRGVPSRRAQDPDAPR